MIYSSNCFIPTIFGANKNPNKLLEITTLGCVMGFIFPVTGWGDEYHTGYHHSPWRMTSGGFLPGLSKRCLSNARERPLVDWMKSTTLPETNTFAPEGGGFPIGISFSRGPFSGAMSASFRKGTPWRNSRLLNPKVEVWKKISVFNSVIFWWTITSR